MKIVHYPHPALRHVSKPIKRVDEELRGMVRRMFELMYEANGVGLAANQVDLPVRLFVVNTEADPAKGQEMVFINPVVSMAKGSEEKEEGCLSLPGLYGMVKRPQRVRVNAYGLAGEEIREDLDGMLSRIVQHELDHLDGVVFTDRLTETGKADALATIEEFESDFRSRRDVGEYGADEEILARLGEIEKKYC